MITIINYYTISKIKWPLQHAMQYIRVTIRINLFHHSPLYETLNFKLHPQNALLPIDGVTGVNEVYDLAAAVPSLVCMKTYDSIKILHSQGGAILKI